MNLEQLRKLLADAVAAQEAILKGACDDNNEPRELNSVETEEYAKLEKKAADCTAMIARMEKVEAARAKVTELDAPAKPVTRVQTVREEDHDEKGEYRGFKSLGEQLIAVARAGMPGGSVDKRLAKLRAASGASEAVGSDGGFLVQTDFQQNLWDKTREQMVLASLCEPREITSPSNAFTWNAIDEVSRATGSRFGGVQAYWRAEADTVTATKPKIRRDKLELESLMAIFYATEEQLEDASALGQEAEEAFTQEMGWILDDALLNGNGVGKPYGILGCPALVTVAKDSSQTAATITYANVRHMKNLLYPASRKNAVWLVGAGVMDQLETMSLPTGNTAVPVFLPAGGIMNRSNETLYGLPVIECEQCQQLGTLGDIVLADFSQYLVIRKGGIQGAQSQHVRFLYGENTFRWTMRVNGKRS